MEKIASEVQLKAFVDSKSTLLSAASSANVQRILETARFREGHLAHIEYGTLQSELGDQAFFAFLDQLGVSRQRFNDIRDSSCRGTPGICFVTPGSLCDPDWCDGR